MIKYPTTYATSVVESVEALTVLIELSGTDITADYGDWCNIDFVHFFLFSMESSIKMGEY